MQVTRTNEDGMVVILYDSRWQHPELLGFKPGSIQWKCLHDLWLKVTQQEEEEIEDDNE